jgi:hypothetical protein
MYNSGQNLISLPDLILQQQEIPSTKNAESISQEKPQNKNVTQSDFATMQNTSLMQITKCCPILKHGSIARTFLSSTSGR